MNIEWIPDPGTVPGDPIAVLCATRNRPKYLLRAAESLFETTESVDLKVYVDSDQIQLYLHYADWDRFGKRIEFTVDRQLGPNGSLNVLYHKYRDRYGIFGVVPDDSQFRRPGWDKTVRKAIQTFPGRIGVVSPAHSDGNYCAYPYVSREWIDIVGWYAYPEAHSFIWDTCQEMLGEATNIVYLEANEFWMEHECLQSQNFAEHLKIDEHAFIAWCVVHRKGVVKKLRDAVESAMRKVTDAEARGRGVNIS